METTAPSAPAVAVANGLSPAQRKLVTELVDSPSAPRLFSVQTRQAVGTRGLVVRVERGVWALTELGREVAGVVQARDLLRMLQQAQRAGRLNGDEAEAKVAELKVRAGR